MKRAVAWIRAFAFGLGAPGLFLLAFLDSSILSLPEVVDLLLVYMITQHPHRMLLYASMATAGSVLGCYVLYVIAKKGGEAFVRRRFHERHVDRGFELFRRYGVWAIIVPSILPPPAPFKIFVLLAGVADMSTARFLGATAAGRGLRYFGEALLALWYGQAALEFLDQNTRPVAYVLTGLIVVGGIVWYWRRTRRG